MDAGGSPDPSPGAIFQRSHPVRWFPSHLRPPPPLVLWEDEPATLAPYLREIATRGSLAMDPALLYEKPWHDEPVPGEGWEAYIATLEKKQRRPDPEGWVASKAAASYLGFSTVTLSVWRRDGRGPPWTFFGHRVLYQQAALETFLRTKVRKSFFSQRRYLAGDRRLGRAAIAP